MNKSSWNVLPLIMTHVEYLKLHIDQIPRILGMRGLTQSGRLCQPVIEIEYHTT